VQAKRKRIIASIAVAGLIPILAACIGAPVYVEGTGTITVTWDNGVVERGDGIVAPDSWGDTMLFCETSVGTCDDTNWTYAFLPASLASEAVISAGDPVFLRDYSQATLPPGDYVMQVYYFDVGPSGTRGDNFDVRLDFPTGRDLSIWHQSVGRESADSRCPAGWQSSWAQWPGEGAGGFVCNKMIYKYYPDEAVYVAGTPSLTDWLVSLPRDSADTECPDGFSGSWAQWPNEGAGGFVCNAYSSEGGMDAVSEVLQTSK
jgi:hypothetical protein